MNEKLEPLEEAMEEAAETAEEAVQETEEPAEAVAAEAAEEKVEEAPEPLEEKLEEVVSEVGNFLAQNIVDDPEADDNDRLMALLSYVSQMFIPLIVPIILLISETSEKRPFQKYHAVHSLAVGIVAWVLEAILGTLVAGLWWTCIGPVLLGLAMLVIWLLPLYYAILAYQGKRFEIPYLTKFMREQGWL